MTIYTRIRRGVAQALTRSGHLVTVRQLGPYWIADVDGAPGRICARAAQAVAAVGAPPLDILEAEIRAERWVRCRACGDRITDSRRDADGTMHVETCGGRRP